MMTLRCEAAKSKRWRRMRSMGQLKDKLRLGFNNKKLYAPAPVRSSGDDTG